jgi:hypothetical protein
MALRLTWPFISAQILNFNTRARAALRNRVPPENVPFSGAISASEIAKKSDADFCRALRGAANHSALRAYARLH